MQGETNLTDGDVPVGALKHLVHAFGAERGAEDAGDGLSGGDVGLLSIQTSQPSLLLLLLEYDERPPELVERQRHFPISSSGTGCRNPRSLSSSLKPLSNRTNGEASTWFEKYEP